MEAERHKASLIAVRGQIKARLTRFDKYCESLQPSKLTEIRIRLQKIEPLYEEFERLQSQLEVIDASPEHEQERQSMENKYFHLISKVTDFLERHSNIPAVRETAPTQEVVTQTQAKGDYRDWVSFYDSFVSLIHDNASLNKIQKFQYLKSCLKGDACKCIEALCISEGNYVVAWEALKERFNHKRLIIQSQINILLNLPVVNKDVSSSLRQLLDNFTSTFESLKGQGLPVESWDALLVPLVTAKFDFVTRREWETRLSPTVLPTLKELIQFISNRCQILESLNADRCHLKQAPNSSAQKKSVTRNGLPRQSANLTTNKRKCRVCSEEDHLIYYCSKLQKMSVPQRIAEIKRLNLCINCLRDNHKAAECTNGNCKYCHQRHNSRDSGEVAANDGAKGNAALVSHSNSKIQNNSQILLSTAIILIKDSSGNYKNCRALLDVGSQSNFITRHLITKLKLKPSNTNVPIIGISQTLSQVSQIVEVEIKSVFNSYSASVRCLVLPHIIDRLPTYQFSLSQIKIPPNIQLADPQFNEPGPIDVLIGAELFWERLYHGQIHLQGQQPHFQKTHLGWVVGGIAPGPNVSRNTVCNLSVGSLESQISRFWEVGEPQLRRDLSNDKCEIHFKETVHRNELGQFIVSLPFKSDTVELGESRSYALKRFYSIEKRLDKNPDLKHEYIKFMREYFYLNHMELVPNSEETVTTNCFYLPHHAVIRQDSISTKLRVVFDGSAKSTNGVSLNDTLLPGPVLQQDILSILLRFRKYQTVIAADISKMYRQIWITDEHKDYQRILWRESPEEHVRTYRLCTVTYGTTSAPYLAIRCLRELALKEGISLPKAQSAILNDIYVDDLLTGSNTPHEAIRLATQIRSILQKGGFELHKWASNEPLVLPRLNVGSIQASAISLDNDGDTKTLGLVWNCTDDALKYSIQTDVARSLKRVSKRSILSTTARYFDPLGLLAPVFVKIKILLQKLWSLRLNWDESIPHTLYTLWSQFITQIHCLNQLSVPRKIIPNKKITRVELHAFCDASEAAYGACIYIKTLDEDLNSRIHLVCAKSRVAPLKIISLPRLELCGALMSVQLMNKVITALELKINQKFFWTDSTLVLNWISKPANTWKVFVANRVSEIQSLSGIQEWYHVKSKENPADLVSRGLLPSDIIESHLWWQGPSWLSQHSEFNQSNIKFTEETTELENLEKRKTVLISEVQQNDDWLRKFSSYTRLQRVTAWMRRFIYNCKHKDNKRKNNLSVTELTDATTVIIQLVQKHEFRVERLELQKKGLVRGSSKLSSLSAFLDTDGLIRVGGRLKNARIQYDMKYPIVLPSKHYITKLLIEFEHRRHLHAGPQATLAAMRERFWPLDGRNTVRHILRKCVRCFRENPPVISQKMGSLPLARIEPSRPFAHCGVDYGGPLLVREGRGRGKRSVKAYVALFVCLSTKAIHIELVCDCTTASFLSALRRFMSRRGKPSHLYSDNGTNFTGANNELRCLRELFVSEPFDEHVKASLSQEHVEWHFIPPHAPHMGGLWEAGIKSIKTHLKRVSGNVSLTYDEMYTLLVQIEACLNSRPLIPLSSDPNDMAALTPGHFLNGAPLTTIPEPDLMIIPENRLSRWQLVQKITQHYWRRWSREYLHVLQQRFKWKTVSNQQILIGMLVLVREENLPPLRWKLGRIVELHPGLDNLVRAVTLRTSQGTIKRCITKISILPLE